MGIRFLCPNGHKLNVKSFLAGKRAICPQCGAKVLVPDAPDSPAAEMPLQTGGIVTNPVSASIPRSPLQDTASPSIIIAIAENEVVAPTIAEGQAVVEPDLPPVGLDIPESVVILPRPALGAAEPALAPPGELYELRRARNRRRQMAIAIVLFVLVVALAIGLIWVLRCNVEQPAVEKSKPVSLNEKLMPLRIAAAADRLLNRATQGVLRQ